LVIRMFFAETAATRRAATITNFIFYSNCFQYKTLKQQTMWSWIQMKNGFPFILSNWPILLPGLPRYCWFIIVIETKRLYHAFTALRPMRAQQDKIMWVVQNMLGNFHRHFVLPCSLNKHI
jgi:hypothetical protein